MKAALLVLLVAGVAHADAPDPCAAVTEPVATPLRDVAIDAQRAACPRDALGAQVQADVLIDTPGFHGELGGELRLGGRMVFAGDFELSANARLVRYGFAQNAVNKATALQLGPASLGGLYAARLGTEARVGLTALVEVPYTRDDRDTMHTSGELGGVVSAALGSGVILHARLGLVWMHASSSGGSTSRLAGRAGADLVRLFGPLAFAAGADVQAGWYTGLDHVNLRVSAQWRMARVWRGAIGVGLPVGGDERTNAVIVLGAARDLQ